MRSFLFFILLLSILYVLVCLLLYTIQEKLIFFPQKLKKDHVFRFAENFTEVFVPGYDSTLLHALWFKAEKPRGVILYFHGNAGSLDGWGQVAGVYTDLQYDVLIPDYRGFGKSEGNIFSEEQMYQDAQSMYNFLINNYQENEIIVIGYSIGTGMASWVSANYPLSALILETPYYNLANLVKSKLPFVPTFLLKYRFDNALHLQKCKVPVMIVHGKNDDLIPHTSSLLLEKYLKEDDQLILLEDQGHNGITWHPEYAAHVAGFLRKINL
ncbi:MAG: alpha/beta hydrolase [Cyclobacteriaceae bacterium]|nr:alpha/beta hydrolase [Cyclobacteriaceae bacterium]